MGAIWTKRSGTDALGLLVLGVVVQLLYLVSIRFVRNGKKSI